MELSSLTFILFAVFSGLRIFSYIPQIRKVAADTNGASAISYATWGLWTGANIATALYAAVNLTDLYLALVSSLYACCCVTVIALTMLKRHRCPRSGPAPKIQHSAERSPPSSIVSTGHSALHFNQEHARACKQLSAPAPAALARYESDPRTQTRSFTFPGTKRKTHIVLNGVIAEGRAGRIFWDEGIASEHVRTLPFRHFIFIPAARFLQDCLARAARRLSARERRIPQERPSRRAMQ